MPVVAWGGRQGVPRSVHGCRALAAAVVVAMLAAVATTGAAPAGAVTSGTASAAVAEVDRSAPVDAGDDGPVEATRVALAEQGQVERVAGADRVETAVEAARASLAEADEPAPLDAAVLARADDFPDALAGVPLAAAIGAPLLLTDPDQLPAPVATFLDDELADDAAVVVLGGEAAVSATVVDQLEADGWDTERLAGADRHATAGRIARAASDPASIDERFAGIPASPPDTVALASGEAFPDALAMSVPAAANDWPLLLTHHGELPEATRDVLTDWQPTGVEIAGGEAAVSAGVADELADLGVDVTRTSGADRYATSAGLAERFWDTSGHPDGRLVVATGEDFPDALAGGALAAARDGVLALTPSDYPPRPLGDVLLDRVPADTSVLGGTAAVSDQALEGIADLAGHTGRHVADPQLDPASGATIELADRDPSHLRVDITDAYGAPAADSQVELRADGQALDVDTELDGDRLTVALAQLPDALDDGGQLVVELSGTLHTHEPGADHDREGDVAGRAPIDARYTVTAPPDTRTTPEGFEALVGTGPVAGERGSLVTYSLELEPAAGVDLTQYAQTATAILADAERGWASQDAYRLQRVEPADADIRVVVATPATTDALCARAGLDTAGIYSCWNGAFAALNAMRWREGAAPFAGEPIQTYRTYLVNHEVGHGLGYGHYPCPGPGRAAPVMVQQTISTYGCEPNGWPYPQGPGGDP